MGTDTASSEIAVLALGERSESNVDLQVRPVSSVRRNLVANFAGSAWSALLSLALVPLYIKVMGIEAYGLVGFFAILLTLFAPLDAGLGMSASRELASLSVRDRSGSRMRDLLRTLEAVYWSVALAGGVLVTALSRVIAQRWVKPEHLAPSMVQWAVFVMGICITVQWPLSLYAGVLIGIQRQVALNTINAAAATVRGVGSIVVLLWVSPTIVAFFTWQIIATGLQTLVTAIYSWRSLPAGEGQPAFRRDLLRGLAAFTVGMSATTVVNVALTQADKLILSRMLPLAAFGYYTLAGTVAANLLRIVTPFQQAAFPRFSQLSALGDERALADLYHRSCQALAVATLPVAAIIVVFSREILWLWTHDVATADHTSLLVRLLMSGTAVNAIISLPYTLQLANGWVRLGLTMASCSAVVLVPSVIILSMRYGAPGATTVWLVLNVVYFVFLIQLMHKRLLPAEKARWYLEDVTGPLLACVFVALIGRLAINSSMSRISMIAALAGVSAAALMASALAAPLVRQRLFQTLQRVAVPAGRA